MNILRLIFAISILGLSSCGFHLANSEFPASLKKIYFVSDQPYSEFTRMFKDALQSRGSQLVTAPELAPVTIHLLSSQVSEAQTSVGSSQETRQYSVTFTASFELQNPKGQIISGPMTLASQQNMTVFSGVLVENTSQYATVKQIAERDVLHRMFDILQSPQTQKRLAS